MARRVFQMRDKHLSTTNLYPKQIEQSLPKDVVPVAPEPETYTPTGEEPVAQYITIDGTVYKVGGTYVIANPTLAGTEVDLEGLQVGDTKYKVPSGSFTQEQANWTEADNTKPDYIKNKPNLATVATSGDYEDLINKPDISSKYLVHESLEMSSYQSYSAFVYFDLINTSNAFFNYDGVVTKLTSLGLTSGQKMGATGYVQYNSNYYPVDAVRLNSNNVVEVSYNNGSSLQWLELPKAQVTCRGFREKII